MKKFIPLLAEKGYSCQNTKQAKDETTVVPVEHVGYKKGKGSAGPTKSKKQKVYTYTPLLIATITGFVPIVKEILEQHPQAAEHGSVDQQNILHLAIKHRQKEIFELIESKPTIRSRLNARIDGDRNTILHKAADRIGAITL
ncbi:unnamed protein product [Prunus armeniaca]|uniref:Uncharacterized protein n=1 Tax=Prunus armeniaca TaxID=36596 RepID=A0A6J5X067_PRUAR|nr:unnamed protein product [Prunus armeniaca]CAB4306101.1 unnamed protein product [Prunus armeniaca]